MAGGTHADHSNVEAFLGVTFSATSKPFTDAQVDAMCVASEALIVSELEPGKSLPTSASTSWRQLVVMIVIYVEAGRPMAQSQGRYYGGRRAGRHGILCGVVCCRCHNACDTQEN